MVAANSNASHEATVSRPPEERPYVVMVSLKFILFGLLSTVLLAFSVGRAARIILLEGPRRALLAPPDQSTLRNRPDSHPEGYAPLPPPIARKGRPVPKTVYTSKNFDTARTATSASLLIRRSSEEEDHDFEELHHVCVDRKDGSKQCSRGRDPDAVETYQGDDDDDDEEHLPAGQHLLVDMKNVDRSFLNSEERLAGAMVDVVNEASLTLLSYHCHRLVPAGVSCVGVLLESHVSFHTWPAEGVITLDLFTCGSNPLVPVVPLIERLFGVAQKRKSREDDDNEQVQVKWAHKLRGFRPHKSGPLETWDMGVHILGDIDLEMKKSVASIQSEYQQLDVFDVIIPRTNQAAKYRRSLSGDGSYESLHPELFRPDRILFLDGKMQSRLQADAAYHEGLVHPAMFAHSNPERVAIIGGGEGSTLREVLKHNTVKEATIIEIDEVIVSASREYLPEWSDCSDLVDSADWCGDDPRARIVNGDAFAWFLDRYGDREMLFEPLDVIIMDALDPETDVRFAKALYDDLSFAKALYNGLSEEGMIIIQLGASAEIHHPAENTSKFAGRSKLFTLLEDAGFESINVYEESHCGFSSAWSYAVAFKDYDTRASWYANEAEVQVAIQQRAKRTKSGRLPFEYFDGPTMVAYQVPSKSTEIVFCRQEPTPEECTSMDLQFDADIPNFPSSSFEVRLSEVASGRGVFAKVDISEGSYIGAEDSVHPVQIMPSTLEVLEGLENNFKEARDLLAVHEHRETYGFRSLVYGGLGIGVDCGIQTFVNHGCNGTYNTGYPSVLTELTADIENIPEDMSLESHNFVDSMYSPFIDRHLPYLNAGLDQSLRDISAGEEILSNYLYFVGDQSSWVDDVEELRTLCRLYPARQKLNK